MEPITIITGIIMAVGAIAGIVAGIIKVVKDNENDGSMCGVNRPQPGQTHADIYANAHRPNPYVVENNKRYIQQPLTINTSAPTYVPAPPTYTNIDPVYAPVNMSMMNNARFVPYQTCWSAPPAFQPTYPLPQYTPTERNQKAATDMCEMMNRMRTRPASEDVIECVLASVEPKKNRYGNSPAICST